MATLADLRGRITEQVYDAPGFVTSGTGVLDRWINEAVKKLQEKRNYRVMAATLEANTTVDTRVLVARPDGWKEARADRPYVHRMLGDVTWLRWAGGEEDVRKEFTLDEATDRGPPRWLRETPPVDELGNVNIEVYPFPDGQSDWTSAPAGEYRVVIPYWRYLTVLSDAGVQENWFTRNAEEYIEFYGQWRAFRASWDQDRNIEARALMRDMERDLWRKNVMEELKDFRGFEPRSNVYDPRLVGRM